MNTVDGIRIIDSYKESEYRITYKEKGEDVFTIHKGFNNPKEKLIHIIPFEMFYCYDCRENRYIHLTFNPINI